MLRKIPALSPKASPMSTLPRGKILIELIIPASTIVKGLSVRETDLPKVLANPFLKRKIQFTSSRNSHPLM
jgi:hypothetical protein